MWGGPGRPVASKSARDDGRSERDGGELKDATEKWKREGAGKEKR
jgi:hypothetical protein